MKVALLIVFCLAIFSSAEDPTPVAKPSIFAPVLSPIRRDPSQKPSKLEEKVNATLTDLTDSYMTNLTDEALLFGIYAKRIQVGDHYWQHWPEVVDRDMLRRGSAEDIFVKLLSNDALFYSDRSGALEWVRNHQSVPWAGKFLEDAIQAYQNRGPGWDWNDGDARNLAGLIEMIGDESHRKILDQIEADGASVDAERMALDYRLSHPKEMKTKQLPATNRSSNATASLERSVAKPAETLNQEVLIQRYWILLMAAVVVAAGGIVWLLKRRAK